MKIKDSDAFTAAQVWAQAAVSYKCNHSWLSAMARLRKAYGI